MTLALCLFRPVLTVNGKTEVFGHSQHSEIVA